MPRFVPRRVLLAQSTPGSISAQIRPEAVA